LNTESGEYNESLKKLIVGGVGEYHGPTATLSGTMSRL